MTESCYAKFLQAQACASAIYVDNLYRENFSSESSCLL